MLRFYLSRKLFSHRIKTEAFRDLVNETFGDKVRMVTGELAWPDLRVQLHSQVAFEFGSYYNHLYDRWEALTEAGELWLMANMPPHAQLDIDQL